MQTGRDLHHLAGFHEPFSAISHLLGAALFVVLGIILLRRGRGRATRLAFLAIYAASCVLLLSMSGVYHMMVRGGTAREVLARLDHGAIFILIAGTFTPVHGILFRGVWRWGVLAFIWGAAVFGIVFKTIYFHDLPEWVGLGAYIAMGWCGTVSAALFARMYGLRLLRPLIWGGLAYTVGGLADLFRWPTVIPRVMDSHDVFHIAVLIGAICHWRFIMSFAAGPPPRRADAPDPLEPAPPVA
ncbi:MAG: hemolysin III family protein [Phycisphaerales bacterium]|nr:hemolysin III family protein [Phycisphaerales bacterium]